MKKISIIILIMTITVVYAGEFFPADNPNIQYFGRWDFSDPTAPTHSWPGVYIYTEFTGTSISVRLNDNLCYYNVYIDDELRSVFHNSESGDVTKILASGLADTSHTLLLTKRNETSWTKYTFLGFEIDDGKILLPPQPAPDLKIEFIGDSFTSASGNEAPTNDAPDPMQPYTNIDKGFGPIIARNYGAQYHMSSISGIGLTLDWQSNYDFNMPDYFNRTLAYNPTPKWDFEQWIPNLVIIGLGLNDYSGYDGYNSGIEASETAEYINSYHEFISTIKDYYPGVRILAVAPHVEWIRDCVHQVVDTENTSGHDDIFYAQYSYYNGGYVNQGHPNVATHAGIAAEIIAAIDTIDAFSAYIDTIPPVFEKLPETPFTSYEKTVELKVNTDSYATLKYSLEDKSWDDMEYNFDQTGKREHITYFTGEHGQDYTLYVRGSDVTGNTMQASAEITFSIDTSKVSLNWNNQDYNDTEWTIAMGGFGFGTTKSINTEIPSSKTAYFRKYFTMENKESYFGLGFLIQGIGGSVIYLNSQEIGRINLPDDEEIEYATACDNDSYFQKVITIDENNGYDKVINGRMLSLLKCTLLIQTFQKYFSMVRCSIIKMKWFFL